MPENWADAKKHAASVDERAIAAILRHRGIALRKRDSSLVSFADKAEVARVRDWPGHICG
jgi:hypothetical protein